MKKRISTSRRLHQKHSRWSILSSQMMVVRDEYESTTPSTDSSDWPPTTRLSGQSLLFCTLCTSWCVPDWVLARKVLFFSQHDPLFQNISLTLSLIFSLFLHFCICLPLLSQYARHLVSLACLITQFFYFTFFIYMSCATRSENFLSGQPIKS